LRSHLGSSSLCAMDSLHLRYGPGLVDQPDLLRAACSKVAAQDWEEYWLAHEVFERTGGNDAHNTRERARVDTVQVTNTAAGLSAALVRDTNLRGVAPDVRVTRRTEGGVDDGVWDLLAYTGFQATRAGAEQGERCVTHQLLCVRMFRVPAGDGSATAAAWARRPAGCRPWTAKHLGEDVMVVVTAQSAAACVVDVSKVLRDFARSLPGVVWPD